MTAPWARRTLRLAQRLSGIGLALGGAAGARLSGLLGVAASRNTLLQLVRSIPLPPIVTPETLGVDDFCFRKCKTYGTALIDLERSRPIALLKDAKAETLAEWLKAHPGIKVVSRDRSKTYESGIRARSARSHSRCRPFSLIAERALKHLTKYLVHIIKLSKLSMKHTVFHQ